MSKNTSGSCILALVDDEARKKVKLFTLEEIALYKVHKTKGCTYN
jgi:hypothetical protein